ncbi:hypothetical protein FRAHR75_90007 [Frankia sp. Hr75.2]|nr:hypothetical protein FRAHR75_90007 [Frankia sp. Hr75.2]SQD96104.1 hypothetical protein FMEAI12_3440046 [Parafrankia sp. Ea1.12]
MAAFWLPAGLPSEHLMSLPFARTRARPGLLVPSLFICLER